MKKPRKYYPVSVDYTKSIAIRNGIIQLPSYHYLAICPITTNMKNYKEKYEWFTGVPPIETENLCTHAMVLSKLDAKTLLRIYTRYRGLVFTLTRAVCSETLKLNYIPTENGYTMKLNDRVVDEVSHSFLSSTGWHDLISHVNASGNSKLRMYMKSREGESIYLSGFTDFKIRQIKDKIIDTSDINNFIKETRIKNKSKTNTYEFNW